MKPTPKPLQVAVWGDGLQAVFRDGRRVRVSRQQLVSLLLAAQNQPAAGRRSLPRSNRRLQAKGLIDDVGVLTRRGRALVGWLVETRRRDLRSLRELTRPLS